MKRMACVVALAAGTGVAGFAALPAIAEPNPVAAVSGLQVSIVPPGTSSPDSSIPLDVKFHGGNIRVIELFVDGTRLTRQALSTRDGRGVIHFTLDPSLITEGSHEILVKAYEADGTCATTTTQLTIAGADVNALVRLEWPKRNAEVQGIVPIKVKVDPTIAEPWVTYIVDNNFLAVRNFGPFVYGWDTSKVDNGPHTIGVEVMDGKTLQIVQKLTLLINVKNVGGFTNIEPSMPAKSTGETGGLPETIEGIAQSAVPLVDLTPRDTGSGLARSHGASQFSTLNRNVTPLDAILPGVQGLSGASISFPLPSSRNAAPHAGGRNAVSTSIRPAVRMSASGGSRRASVSKSVFNLFADPADTIPSIRTSFVSFSNAAFHAPLSGVGPGAIKPMRPDNSRPAPLVTIGAPTVNPPAMRFATPHVAPGLEALANDPIELMPAAKQKYAIAYQELHLRRPGSIAIRPSTNRSIGVAPTIVTHVIAASSKLRKTIDVAFNNKIINFDVPPRVENGLPLAPFRAIFEHSGGTVKWFNQAKVVRAVDNDREIEITIGSKEARVNNQPMTMEAVPYLDRGRTIVPISFLRDAMDMKVSFDPETGHVLIEKK